MSRFSILCAVLFIALSSVPLFAITDEEIFRNFQFSFVNPGARSTAMGGAFIGLADDATAVEANPAGLTILTKPEVSFEFRHATFDSDKLNSSNFTQESGVSASIVSLNDISDLNRPSFLSFVYPVGRVTFGFARQEVIFQEATISEALVLTVDNTDIAVAAAGSVKQEITNWNGSVAFKVSENLSIGGSVRFSQLDWQTNVVNFFAVPFLLPVFETAIDDTDSSIGFNIGALYTRGKFSVGAVYKRNPTFEVVEVERGDFANKPGPFTNKLNVPDIFGGGVAVKPTDNFTLTGDIVFIKYEDLTDGLLAGYNILTIPAGDNDVTYKVDNEVEIHIGAETVVFLKNTPLALRQGYYRRPSNSLIVESVRGALAGSKEVLDFFFTERDDEDHFTFGAGLVFGPHFQVDWAWDIAKSTNAFVASTVVRF